jgi:hypothetical protein
VNINMYPFFPGTEPGGTGRFLKEPPYIRFFHSGAGAFNAQLAAFF